MKWIIVGLCVIAAVVVLVLIAVIRDHRDQWGGKP